MFNIHFFLKKWCTATIQKQCSLELLFDSFGLRLGLGPVPFLVLLCSHLRGRVLPSVRHAGVPFWSSVSSGVVSYFPLFATPVSVLDWSCSTCVVFSLRSPRRSRSGLRRKLFKTFIQNLFTMDTKYKSTIMSHFEILSITIVYFSIIFQILSLVNYFKYIRNT